MALSVNLKTMRQGFGYSVTDIAKYLGMSEESVYLMENEDVFISSMTLEKLCDLYGCDANFVYFNGFEQNRLIAGPEVDFISAASVNRLSRNLQQMEKLSRDKYLHIGDTVYCLQDNEVYQYIITGINNVDSSMYFATCGELIGTHAENICFFSDQIGENIFLYYEDAMTEIETEINEFPIIEKLLSVIDLIKQKYGG